MEIKHSGMSQLDSNYRGHVSMAKTNKFLVISGTTRKGFPSRIISRYSPPRLGHILLPKIPRGEGQQGQLQSICHRPQGLA